MYGKELYKQTNNSNRWLAYRLQLCLNLFLRVASNNVLYYNFITEEIKGLFKLVTPKIAFCQRESLCDYQKAVEELGLDTRLVTFDGDEHSMAELMDSCDKSGTIEDFE